jgi:transcriptional regulator with XRE-family HTH domain
MKKQKIIQARIMMCNYLRDIAKEKGITHEQIAIATGFQSNNISRMLSGKYAPSLDNFIILCDAINTYFFIIDKDADNDLVEIMRNRWQLPPLS